MSQDWSVVGRAGDPAPGDPSRARSLATRVLGNAELVERNTTRLRDIAANGGDLRLRGDFAQGILHALAELPDELAKLSRAYRGCGEALQGYAGDLDHARSVAGDALRRGTDAYWALQPHLGQIRSLAPAVAPELTQPRFFMDQGHTAGLLAQIPDASVQQAVQTAVVRARVAESDRQDAMKLAQQAADLHESAGTRAAQRIDDALSSSGIKNKSFWDKAWNWVTTPFHSWDDFVNFLEIVVAVVAVVAFIFGGPILGAILLILGAVLLVSHIVQVFQGKASWADVGLDLLLMLPGARAIGELAKVARAGRIFGPLRATALGRLATGLRSGLSGFATSSRAAMTRVLGRDPVDVATGEMVLAATDAELPAASLPLVVRRTYLSSYRAGRLFGPGWSSPLDQRLEMDVSGVYFASVDGVLQRFAVPESDDPVYPDAGERVALRLRHDGTLTVSHERTGVVLHFGEIAGAPTGMFNLTRMVDRNGNTVELDYAPGGVLTTVRHYGGYVLDVVTEGGLVTQLRAGGQVLLRYGHDAAGRLTRVVNSSGRPLVYDYDDQGRLVGWTDRTGAWYRYAYDAAGRCVGTQGVDGILSGSLHFDDAARSCVEVDSLGHRTTYHHNAAYQIERVVDPLGHATTMSWDRANRLLSRTDALGQSTSWSYDAAGNVTAVERADGSRGTVSYNALQLPVTAVDVDGATWRYQYDERGNLVAVTDPAGGRSTVTVDERGRPAEVTDAAGQVTRFATNAAGLVTGVVDAAGAAASAQYDPLGRPVAITDPVGGVTRLGWSVEGRLASWTGPDGATVRCEYDAQGHLVERVDPVGGVTRYEHTGFDQVAAVVDPDGSRYALTYDTEQRLVAFTNPAGLVWRFAFDPAGNLVRETDFSGRTHVYHYDAVGRLTARTNTLGQTVSYGLDPLGRVVESRADEVATSFRYDPMGRLVAATGPGADLRLERDGLGRVVAQSCNGRVLRIEYDAVGRRVARTTPAGNRTHWAYGVTGLPTAMRAAAGPEVHFGHDGLGRETLRRIGSVALTSAWDLASRLTAQTVTGAAGTPVAGRAYTYRPDGNLTDVHDELTGDRHYELDPLGRVTAVLGSAESYAYDLAGNVTHDATGPRSYAGTRVTVAGQVRYEHDAEGRLVRRTRAGGDWRYAWDAQDRLVGVTTPEGQRWSYQYDPLGRRIAKTRLTPDGAPAERVEFAWDGPVLAEQSTSDGGTVTWDHDPVRRRPVGQTTDGRFAAVVTDLVGTPLELVDPDGTLLARQETTLWGEAGGAAFALRFPGQYHDAESELNYNLFRYYDPASGRYASNDPLGLGGGDDPHQYVRNPLTWLDPLGLFANMVAKLPTKAFNNMVAQIENEYFWNHSVNPVDVLLAGAGGVLGGPFGGRLSWVGGVVSSGATTFLTGLYQGNLNLGQVAASGAFGGVLGHVGEALRVQLPFNGEAFESGLERGMSVVSGVTDFTGWLFSR